MTSFPFIILAGYLLLITKEYSLGLVSLATGVFYIVYISLELLHILREEAEKTKVIRLVIVGTSILFNVSIFIESSYRQFWVIVCFVPFILFIMWMELSGGGQP
jgi:hypothetical protein